MSRKGRGSANTNTRQRDLPAVGSAEGKQIAEQLGTIFSDFKALRPDLVRSLIPPPVEGLAWTAGLPGFDRARDSGVDAFLRVLRRSELLRGWAVAGPKADLSSIAYRALAYGLGAEEYLRRYLSFLPAEDNLEREQRLVAALRRRKNPIKQRLGSDLPASPCGYDLSQVVAGDLQNSFEFWLGALWTGTGLWLAANAEDATALLSYISEWDNRLHGLRVPKPNTYSKLVRELRLHSYEGRGHLVFSKKCYPQPDAVLRREAGLDK